MFISVILVLGFGILMNAVGYFLYVKFIKSRELTEEDFDELPLLDDDFLVFDDNSVLECNDDEEIVVNETLAEVKNEATKPKPSRYARRYRQEND